jgi:hypothetical protein
MRGYLKNPGQDVARSTSKFPAETACVVGIANRSHRGQPLAQIQRTDGGRRLPNRKEGARVGTPMSGL